MPVIKKTFNISGMHCGACATSIQMLLSMQAGVAKVSVDYDAKKAEVEYDDSKIKEADIIKNVEEVGYKAQPA